ncbi:enoyl-CoA hydratase-related protein [Caulobacter soli]|uniref:enoyl-CoA hydratase-related protein n=1 Tax=Caulobacter soli TaxID=2708539 RepID=UPI0013EACEFC|nr:enoyl-CoA hydratase-related protein [Caulobacter soli]
MSYAFLTVEKIGRITTVTINRPDRHNALNAEAQVELAHAFDAFEADDEQWVAILTGAGPKAFCAGHDLMSPMPQSSADLPPSGFGGITSRLELTKPVIAAVNGIAMGGGFEIALACDIVVAAQNATFALPEVKVGLAALGGGILRLPREIGLKRAMGLMLTGRRLTAAEGLSLGFVNEVVQSDALAGAMRWAEEILAASPMSVRATKQAALQGLSEPLATALEGQWSYPAVQRMLKSEDAAEGPAAFAAKRAPEWKGR